MVGHLIKPMRRKPLWRNAFSTIALRHSAAPVRESVTWGAPPRIPNPGPDQRRGVAMLIRRKKGWELPESAATDEAVFHDRRRLIQGIAAGPILASALLRGGSAIAAADEPDPSAALYPVKRNDKYALDRPITDPKYSTIYNNF